ncbi:FG-GAP repeat domain-containing protein [Runella salmonicolor]|uniref:VCBS repeat-containing protein n=1 Tax=Runella salmonicolor TaxID=2950278 RepID=A0ABT1FRQ8_9BACT|nr:VCBS repeat-containing protein [Runella salmonicolor]MCP1384185.1 VCBS repeat-containing protein [Runella salmonicolor]
MMLRSAFALSLLVLFCFFVGCQKDPAQHEPLARQHCGGCHLFPDPNLLPKTVWEKDVLPYMALRLGLDEDLKKIRKLNANDLKVKAAHPLISQEDWQKIKDYYLDLAPKRLTPLVSSQKATLIEKQFEIRPLFSPIEQEMANVTCVRIDEANKGVYVADEVNQTVWLMDAEGKAVKRFGGQPAVSDLQFLDASHQNLLVTYIGETVKVTYNANGYAQTVNMGQKSANNASLLLTKLLRPTQTLQHDMDNDGQPELITCEFGVIEGKFSVWKRNVAGTYEANVLSATPGALRTVVVDWNKDGMSDLMTLFAQGDERIVLYLNKGNLKFEEKTLLRFPPVFGSSYFDVVDMNKDGRLDILYTCGDNADLSVIFKPYHGLYIFENQGKEEFRQSYFYPIDGAYKVAPADVDADGDLDLVSIAFYDDIDTNPQTNVLYFENQKGKFKPWSIPIGRMGRWLTLDTGDIDGDGDIDFALGSHPLGLTPGRMRGTWARNGLMGAYLLNLRK